MNGKLSTNQLAGLGAALITALGATVLQIPAEKLESFIAEIQSQRVKPGLIVKALTLLRENGVDVAIMAATALFTSISQLERATLPRDVAK